MPVPATISLLSTTAGSNSPPGTESPTTADDYLRAHAAFIAQLRDRTAADWPNTPAGNIAATTVQAAINELDSEKANITAIQAQTHTAFTTAGTATAYTLTPSPAITAYTAGQSFFVTFNAASGPAPTLAISGIATPPNLVKQLADGSYTNIAANDFPANHRSRVTLLSTTQAWVETVPATAIRAWALFDGTLGGTNAPTTGSNVTSVTRNSGGGSYTVNLAAPMASANYAVVCTATGSTGSAGRVVGVDSRTTTSFRILTENTSGVVTETAIVSFTVIGA